VTPPVRQSPPRAGDPYGLGIVGSFLAPVLAIVGLLIVAIITINLLNGELPLGLGRGTGTNGGTTGDGGPARTPAPSNVVVVPEPSTPTDEPLFLGAMTYAKAGNIWVQTDDGPTQLTDSGTASMPSWSPDGKYVYYIETKRSRGFWPVNGRPGTYDMEVPHLMRVPVDRSGPPEDLHSGRFREGNLIWFSWMRQPVVSPSGKTIAMVTDQPRPDERDVVVQFYNLKSGKFSRPDLPVTSARKGACSLAVTRERFHVSAAEVGGQDTWQRATLGFAVVASEARLADATIDEIDRYLWSRPEIEVLDSTTHWLT